MAVVSTEMSHLERSLVARKAKSKQLGGRVLMKSFRSVVSLATLTLLSAGFASSAWAQTGAPIYTWDHAFGFAAGPNLELWAKDFGDNAIGLSNAIDGELTITEDATKTQWAIHDDYNFIRESTPGGYGGLDLTGLESIKIEIGHNGTKSYGGQIYVNPQTGTSGSGCCDFIGLGGFNVAPGAPQTFTVPLSAVGASQIAFIRSMGVQIFDHTWD